MREARITARLHHPHAVPVFDAVESDGQPCLIMQYLPSIPLSAVLRQRGPLPVAEVARFGAEVASALAAAHQLGIVHRDVKPGNVLIADEDGRALISDFGISHALGDATLTSTGLVHGTPAFLAPEVARGEESSFAADVFSLGSALYAAVEGAPPFGADANPIAMLYRVALGRFEPPKHAGRLTPLMMEMLDDQPDARPSMPAVADRLRTLRAEAGPSAAVIHHEARTDALYVQQGVPVDTTPVVSAPVVSGPTGPSERTLRLPVAAAIAHAVDWCRRRSS
jgi:serine/threonine protein kinase